MKVKGLLLLCLMIFNLWVNAQDLFDLQHTRQFSVFLMEQQKYQLAIPELERWHFLAPDDDSAKCLLLKAYRKNDNQDFYVDKLISRLYPNKSKISSTAAREYALILLQQQKSSALDNFLNHPNRLNAADSHELVLHSLILKKSWKTCIAYGKSPHFPAVLSTTYEPVLQLIQQKKTKSPWLAASFSTVIPGSGKIYTGFWKDGLIALMSIGIASWQAWSGFKTDGQKSAYGYAFLSIGGVLYFSNIYGSFKSAKVYNKNYDKKISAKAMDMLEHGVAKP